MDYISASDMKDTKSGNGRYLELEFTVLEGEFKGRKLWARLNLENPNATTVQIARAELSAICRAVGVMQPRDSMELHNLPLEIHVRCKKRTDVDEIVNEIKGYEPKPSTSAQPQHLANSVPPWKRN